MNHLPFKQQTGAFSIMAAGTLLMALLTLVLVVDTSRLYAEQRKLQKLADTAALESISRLASGACGTDPASARRFAEENLRRQQFLRSEEESAIIECVALDTSGEIIQLIQNPNGPAVRAQVLQEVPSSLILRSGAALGLDFPATTQLQAEATAARDEPVAVFSIGAQLLQLQNDKLLGILLRTVGVDVDVLTLLDADGLANAQITPSGLLSALGVDIGIQQLKALSPSGLVDLVNTQVGLLGIDELLEVSLDLITDSVLRAQVAALRTTLISNPIIQDIQLQLFGVDAERALISLTSASDARLGSALDAGIGLGQLLSTAILVGVSELERGLVIPELNLLGLVDVQLGVVEPPSIGVGPVGTKAYDAQIRLYLDIDTDNLLGGSLRFLTNLLGTRVHLPVWIDLVSGEATLETLSCDVNPPTAKFDVNANLLGICIGEIPDALRWSSASSCQGQTQETELIKLLHLPVLSGRSNIPALQNLEFSVPPQGLVARDQLTDSELNQVCLPDGSNNSCYKTGANLLSDLGNTTQRLVEGLLDLLSGLFRRPNSQLSSGLDFSQAAQNRLIENLATQYLEATKRNGFYNVADATQIILQGQTDPVTGQQVLPPLIDGDFNFPRAIPTTGLLAVRPVSQWNTGSFSQAFHAYTSVPYSVLDLLGISTLGNGYTSCAGLLTSLLAWNRCVEGNLQQLLKQHQDRYTLANSTDGDQLATPGNQEVSCSGALCLILRPVLNLLKPVLNGVGALLDNILAGVLGVEIGRSTVEVHSIECGTARLVR